MEKQVTQKELDKFKNTVLVNYKKEDSPLMQVLQHAQTVFGYIPIEVQELIGSHLQISTAKINGVVSFYSMFSLEPQGKHSIGVCLGTACYVKGAQRLLDRVSEKINAALGETSENCDCTLIPTRCVGACSSAPVIVTDGKIHAKVTSDDIHDIIDKLKV